MTPLVVEALGMSRLRFVNARTETEASAGKKYSVEPEVSNSSPSDGIQQENRRAAEEAADGSLGIASDGSAEEVGKDEEQVEMPTNDLATNEELEKERSSIDLEKEEKEKEEEKKKKLLKLIDKSAYGSWQDYLVMMTVTRELAELCAKRELIVLIPVVEVMTQPDRTMSITFIGERLFVRREKKRELCGGVYLASDRA
ncbi:uncharacterized protein MONOS_8828 [Monocercomonoides exilis]|uniref:uncharacterized protein n=1 Tax=Monocercomonoides exilis TaxID=2049356 RepID=UPI00355A72E3|nr:hypothetical protein MONOS_8828 [Monocercomonoides exilis]|eukprot:MONOS_8828.1-p1 / transcript=MONOS_8828.1 / gene=MONOS_8828 / organism=Monocercomonoides_exilis_PA203 / gene_product=unspecified product / transcript_product=unspecified product / location=Mono_scaffold00344:23433-24157(+) / protein_length=199 / sequence_SO=supercontig / SO=protein_coding / is_pseudo=false